MRSLLAHPAAVVLLELARDLFERRGLEDQERAHPVQHRGHVSRFDDGSRCTAGCMAHLTRAYFHLLRVGRERDPPFEDRHAQLILFDAKLETGAEHERIARARAHTKRLTIALRHGKDGPAIEPDFPVVRIIHHAQAALRREPDDRPVAEADGGKL